MAVRDVLWACPICRTVGGIRRRGRGEACFACGTSFRRGQGARIAAQNAHTVNERPAAEWLRAIDDVAPPGQRPDGVILGPERVRLKIARRQLPLRFGSGLLGWVEVFDRPIRGTFMLTADVIEFRPGRDAAPQRWELSRLKGIQPASSSLQLALPGCVVSVKFLESSVRLWARVLAEAVRDDCRRRGLDLLELQPCLRTCSLSRADQ